MDARLTHIQRLQLTVSSKSTRNAFQFVAAIVAGIIEVVHMHVSDYSACQITLAFNLSAMLSASNVDHFLVHARACLSLHMCD